MSDSVLYLLTTSGCSLCEKAKTVLWPLLTEHSLRLQEIDIIDYPWLMDSFSVKIPVICIADPTANPPSQTLQWPFDLQQARQWILEHS